jgi:hypothetical protein
MVERNGVRLGQSVRDLDGTPLGTVTALYEDGFATRKGLPFLIRRDYVVRYAEVRGERDGEVVVARSAADIFDLNAGELPPSWRVPAPPGFPSAATPPEASLLREDLARGAIPGSAVSPEPDAATPFDGTLLAPALPRERRERGAAREEAARPGASDRA